MKNTGEIIFKEVPVPEIKDDQVLVKIMNIAVLGAVLGNAVAALCVQKRGGIPEVPTYQEVMEFIA